MMRRGSFTIEHVTIVQSTVVSSPKILWNLEQEVGSFLTWVKGRQISPFVEMLGSIRYHGGGWPSGDLDGWRAYSHSLRSQTNS